MKIEQDNDNVINIDFVRAFVHVNPNSQLRYSNFFYTSKLALLLIHSYIYIPLQVINIYIYTPLFHVTPQYLFSISLSVSFFCVIGVLNA